MAHDVVDRDASREGNATLKVLALLACESLLNFLFNHGIDGATNCRNISAWNGKLSRLGEALC